MAGGRGMKVGGLLRKGFRYLYDASFALKLDMS